MKFLQRSMLAACFLTLLTGAAHAQQSLKDIKERGKIIIGMKTDYKPFSFSDPSGKIVGFEPDIAAELAKRLGVAIELVPVTSANRIQFLQQGKIDMILATMVILPERQKIIDISEPYYGGSPNLLTKKSNGFKKWEDLRSRAICGYQGSIYNRRAIEEYGIRLIALKSSVEALAALKAGNCIGYLDDITSFGALLQEPAWADYETPLPQNGFEPWGVGVRKGDTELLAVVNEIIANGHKTGFLINAEKRWKLPASEFLIQQNKQAGGC